jgi:hypothetical protein
MSNEFKTVQLNEEGKLKVEHWSKEFETFLAKIEKDVPSGRHRALVTTKLEEAYANVLKSISSQKAYMEDV